VGACCGLRDKTGYRTAQNAPTSRNRNIQGVFTDEELAEAHSKIFGATGTVDHTDAE
jgi:hypothetical protein